MTTSLDPAERKEMIEDAQAKIEEAIEILRDAVRGWHLEGMADAYLFPALEMANSDDHGWLGKNQCSVAYLLDKAIEENIAVQNKPRNVDVHQDAMDRAERGEMTCDEAAELGIDLDYGDDEFDDTEDDEDDGLTFDVEDSDE